MTRKMSVVLENTIDELAVLTHMLQAFLRPYPISSGAQYALELSLEEIFVNIVSYAHPDEARHDIQFKVSVDEDMIAMEFIDDGRPFNPLTAEKTGAQDHLMARGEGGLGINFVRQMRDMMEYQRKDDKNILNIWFARDTAEGN
jgi:anti-sigma regulatory factor (Ser/Thr protein kinase)